MYASPNPKIPVLLDPVAAPAFREDARKAFWARYNSWLVNASNEELDQLQVALEQYDSTDAKSLAVLISAIQFDVNALSAFPQSFLGQVAFAYSGTTTSRH
jgi:hypothetical protein